jgi:hypothetical protein
MATARAIANGNWSSTSTWNGGVLPGNGDTVYANGFNVTINQDINIGGANNPTVNAGSFVSGQWYEILFVGTTSWTVIGAASNTAGTVFLATGAGSGTGTAKAIATLTTAANTPAGAAAGGNFAMSTTYAITTDLRAGTTTCLTVTGATNVTVNGIRFFSGTGAGALACNYNATGSLTISSASVSCGSGSSAHSINNASTGSVSITSSTLVGANSASAIQNANTGGISVTSSTLTGGTANANAVVNASTGNVTITSCTVVGGSGSNTHAINNSSAGAVTVTSSTLTGGSASSGFALTNASTGTVICEGCTFVASAFTNAVSAASSIADVRLSGDFLDHWSGWKAINSPKFRLGTTPTAARTRYALAGTTDSYVEMFTADNTGFGLPAATDVRSGVSYGGGAVSGLCAVPAAGSVALGVPVDNTTGTAVLTPAAIRSELAVELGRIDAAISSRLAPNGTLATVTNLTNAPASVTPTDIWSHATRTLTSASGPTAIEIRQELDSNSTQLSAIKSKTDALPSDPADQSLLEAAIAGVTAPSASTVATAVRSELSSELAKVSALNTDRLAQCSTVATTGAQIAAALS